MAQPLEAGTALPESKQNTVISQSGSLPSPRCATCVHDLMCPQGPLYYCIVLAAVALLYWRDSPIGEFASDQPTQLVEDVPQLHSDTSLFGNHSFNTIDATTGMGRIMGL